MTAELQTATVSHFQRKIKLSVFSTYQDGSPSELLRISGVLLRSDKHPNLRATLSTTSPTRTGKELNQGLRGEKQATRYLSQGMT